MSIALPTLRGSAQQALYPFKRTIKANTLVTQNQDGSQQRSVLAPPLVKFDLPFTKLNATDKNSEKAFYTSAVGQFATNETLTLNNVTYTNLSLDSDLYSGRVRAANMWDSGLKLSQTVSQSLTSASTTLSSNVLLTDTTINVASVTGFNGFLKIDSEIMFVTWTPDSTHLTVDRAQLGTTKATHSSGATVSWGPGFTLGQAYPAFPNGTRTQIPWQQNVLYKTDSVPMEAGPKWNYPWYGGHLVSFPMTGLRQWVVGGDMLTDAEAALLEAHFLANWGRFSPFSFTDPETGNIYTDSYYGSDEFTIEYIQPNVNRITLPIESYPTYVAPTVGSGGPGPVDSTYILGSGIAIVTLYFITTHIPGASYTGNAAVGLLGATIAGSSAIIYDPTAYSSRTDSSVWDPHTLQWSQSLGPIKTSINPIDIEVSFWIVGTILGNSPTPGEDKLLVHDCWLDVTYTDTSHQIFRPTIAKAGGEGPPGGDVQNPGSAIGGSSYATILRSAFGPGYLGPFLVLSGFNLS